MLCICAHAALSLLSPFLYQRASRGCTSATKAQQGACIWVALFHMQGSLQPAPASPIYLMQALRRERDLHAQQMSEYRAAYARQLQLQAEREALANGAGDAGELLAAKERELEVCAGRGVGVVLPCQSGWCGVRPVAALPNSLHALG